MISFTHVVQDAEGLHARPATIIAAEALSWESAITVACGERSVSAADPLGLMALDAMRGDTLSVTIEGADERRAAEAMRSAFTF